MPNRRAETIHGERSIRAGVTCMRIGEKEGFTLMEVMIAVAILAITLTVLFGSQSQSLSLAAEAKFNTSAAFLLEQKLAELEAGLIEIYEDEGDFGEDYPQFRWKIEVEEAFLGEYEIFDNLASPIQSVTITVFWSDSPYSQSVDYLLSEKNP